MPVIGHESVLTQFKKMIEAGTLNHAYVLVGPEHVGKQTVATWIAAQLLQVSEETIARHPDVLLVTRAYDEKNERYKRDLTINEIREAVQFASESSFQGGYKVIIISDAERLNSEAGNALLKMLEEPPSQTIFFLLYETVGAIMPTIRSRSQVLTLASVPDAVLSAGLQAAGHQTSEFEALLPLALGRPGLVLTWLQDPTSYESWHAMQAEFWQLIGASIVEKFTLTEPWLSSNQENGGVEGLINRLEIWQQAAVPHVAESLLTTKGLTATDLVLIHQKIQTAIGDLRHNTHPRLTIEALLLALP